MVQTNFQNSTKHVGPPKRATPFFVTKLLHENGCIFLHDSFCIDQAMVQTNFQNFVKHAGPPKRAWWDHALFSLKYHYRKTLQYFCIILFASSRQWSKLIFKILPSMPDHPKGRGGTTPFFRYKIITRKRLHIFAPML